MYHVYCNAAVYAVATPTIVHHLSFASPAVYARIFYDAKVGGFSCVPSTWICVRPHVCILPDSVYGASTGGCVWVCMCGVEHQKTESNVIICTFIYILHDFLQFC